MALYYFPWHELLGEAKSRKENPKPATSIRRDPWPLRASLLLAAVACILRPTNGLIWAPIVVLALTRIGLRGSSPLTVETVFVLFREIILCGSAVIGVSLVADRLYYGFWTFPPYNFLYFNLSKALAVFYGRNPWHYYLLQGLPLLSITSLPFTLYALYKPSATTNDQANILRTLSSSVYVSVIALSVISHKEVRFIYPLLPILNVLAAPYVASFFTTSATPNSAPETRRKPLLYGALAINIILAGYLSLLHQAGTVSVLSALRTEYSAFHPSGAKSSTPNEPLFALFLMPCHSTPGAPTSSTHPSTPTTPYPANPLHTEPNSPERDNYRDEADRFYDDPLRFLSRELFSPDRRPSGALPAPATSSASRASSPGSRTSPRPPPKDAPSVSGPAASGPPSTASSTRTPAGPAGSSSGIRACTAGPHRRKHTTPPAFHLEPG
uniref:Mannosyltransferase n=1 Tax=Bionectria ochroleuca TaxID=29856 RepID=A0A8H7N252_BIOOC